jgi:dTDP-glucose 4,6-dehydratase
MERTCLVTGAAGFIGSHLVEYLENRGWRVRALVRYNSRRSAGWLDSLEHRAQLFFGDIRDPATVEKALAGCDTVFHLAALIGIPYSYETPESYVAVNIQGTLNLLQAARKHPLKHLVITSTSEVYGTARTQPQTEEHPLQAQSPYAATKIAADQLALSFHRSFGLPVTVVRPFNTYGPRQSPRAVIPAIIGQLLHPGKELRLGDLTPRRDFNFVTDTVRGLAAAAETEAAVGHTVHLGSGRAVAIGEVVELLQQLAGTELPVVTEQKRLRPAESEVRHLEADAGRARELLGWKPEIGLEEGLERTWRWFRKFYSGSDNLRDFRV